MVLGTRLLLGSYLLLFFLNFGCSYDDLPCMISHATATWMQTTLVNQERELDRCSVDLKHFILFHPFARNDSSGLLFCLSVHAYIPSIALLKVHVSHTCCTPNNLLCHEGRWYCFPTFHSERIGMSNIFWYVKKKLRSNTFWCGLIIHKVG